MRVALAEFGMGEDGGAGAVDEDRRFLMRARAIDLILWWGMCDRMEEKENNV